uniref:PfN44 n=1 Tax=Pinctada fucata TaxID=50426 RepID=M1T9E3_PINFU|nr:PfN44 [Pinctada fucata]
MFFKIVLVSLLFSQINGFCYKTFGRIDKTVSGRLIPVCEFNGLDILDGSTFSTAACTECVCNEGTLACCGYGINGGKVVAPPGCKTVADGCEVLVVKEYDETLDCFTGQPINGNIQVDTFIGGVTGNRFTNEPFIGGITGNRITNEPFSASVTGTNVDLSNLPMDTTGKGTAGGVPIDMNMLTTDLSQQMLGSPEQTNSIFDAMFGPNAMISPDAGSLATMPVDMGSSSPVDLGSGNPVETGSSSPVTTNMATNDAVSSSTSVDAGTTGFVPTGTATNITINETTAAAVQDTSVLPTQPTSSPFPSTMKTSLGRKLKPDVNTMVKMEKNNMWDAVMNQIVPPNPFLMRGAPVDVGMFDMFSNTENAAQSTDSKSQMKNPFLIRGAPVDMSMLDMFSNAGNVAQTTGSRSQVDMLTSPTSNPNSLADMIFLSKFADFPGF